MNKVRHPSPPPNAVLFPYAWADENETLTLVLTSVSFTSKREVNEPLLFVDSHANLTGGDLIIRITVDPRTSLLLFLHLVVVKCIRFSSYPTQQRTRTR